jgi:hypothetical protein
MAMCVFCELAYIRPDDTLDDGGDDDGCCIRQMIIRKMESHQMPDPLSIGIYTPPHYTVVYARPKILQQVPLDEGLAHGTSEAGG